MRQVTVASYVAKSFVNQVDDGGTARDTSIRAEFLEDRRPHLLQVEELSNSPKPTLG
jgi:hypothetical protein